MNLASALSVLTLTLLVILFFYFRWFIKRRIADDERLAEYKLEVQRLITDLDYITDRDALLVEDRIKTLKTLLEDTDKRIAVYVRELERNRSGEALYTKLKHESDQVTPAPPVPEKKDIRIQIAELSLQGHDAARIASKLKISISEVELALSFLRK